MKALIGLVVAEAYGNGLITARAKRSNQKCLLWVEIVLLVVEFLIVP
jgi:hypothetical protein